MIIDTLKDRIAQTDSRINRAKEATSGQDPKLGMFVRSGLRRFRRQRLDDLRKLLRQRS
ncbi:MAG: hypothetical protein RLN72_07055 [Henriciella sp.]